MCGVGSVGRPLVERLTTLEVAHLTLVDFKRYSPTSVETQCDPADVGQWKVDVVEAMARGSGLATAAYAADIFSVPDGAVRDGSLVISCADNTRRTDRREPLGRAHAMPAAENQYRAAVRLCLGACLPSVLRGDSLCRVPVVGSSLCPPDAPAQLRCGDISTAHGRLTHTGRRGRRPGIARRTRHPLPQRGRGHLVRLGNAARCTHSPRDSVATRARTSNAAGTTTCAGPTCFDCRNHRGNCDLEQLVPLPFRRPESDVLFEFDHAVTRWCSCDRCRDACGPRGGSPT